MERVEKESRKGEIQAVPKKSLTWSYFTSRQPKDAQTQPHTRELGFSW